MKYAIAVLVLVGAAWGQFAPGWSAECVTVDATKHLITPNYEREDCWPNKKADVYVGDVCGMEGQPKCKDSAEPHITDPGVGTGQEIDGSGNVMINGNNVTAKNPPQGTVMIYDNDGKEWHPWPGPDHITGPGGGGPGPLYPDVPAIKEMRKTKCSSGAYVCDFNCQCTGEMVNEPHDTCADKSRILETAEDGKLWCHKPETEPK
jgi:hypothetical protein